MVAVVGVVRALVTTLALAVTPVAAAVELLASGRRVRPFASRFLVLGPVFALGTEMGFELTLEEFALSPPVVVALLLLLF